MVPVLAATGDGTRDTGRMPGTNTGDLKGGGREGGREGREVSIWMGRKKCGREGGREGGEAYLAETTMGLTRQAGDTPTGDHALAPVALGGADGVDVLVLGEDGVDRDVLIRREGGREGGRGG